jgi:hypothetical protein
VRNLVDANEAVVSTAREMLPLAEESGDESRRQPSRGPINGPREDCLDGAPRPVGADIG